MIQMSYLLKRDKKDTTGQKPDATDVPKTTPYGISGGNAPIRDVDVYVGDGGFVIFAHLVSCLVSG